MRPESLSTEGPVPSEVEGKEGGGLVPPAEGGPERRRPSRRRFLGGAAAGVGVLAAAPGTARAAVPQLYANENRRIFQEFLADENSHANFLVGTLGSNARPRPIFQNLIAPNVNQFVVMAYTFEAVTTRAYVAFLPYLNSPGNLSAASRIATVEGRHSGYLSALLNVPIVPGGLAFEIPMFQQEVLNHTTPFVASLNGGTTPAYEEARSDPNDINILNFALFLEFLESEFYRINVPRFFA